MKARNFWRENVLFALAESWLAAAVIFVFIVLSHVVVRVLFIHAVVGGFILILILVLVAILVLIFVGCTLETDKSSALNTKIVRFFNKARITPFKQAKSKNSEGKTNIDKYRNITETEYF